jgi:hypothetical protein
MAVKPFPKIQESFNDKSKKIEEFVNKGDTVTTDLKEVKKDEWTMISVRIPVKLLNTLDNERSKQIGLTRNAWVLQTLQKKLENVGQL